MSTKSLQTLLAPEVSVKGFFHAPSSTISYVLEDTSTLHCAIIDPVLDYSAHSARTGTGFIDTIIAYVRERDLLVDWILETHAHADHLSAAQYLRKQLHAPVGIGEHIRLVQKSMQWLFNIVDNFVPDGLQFDHLFFDGERIKVGGLEIRVMNTPGHTPACVSYLTGNVAVIGDTLFMPDYGTARADFPGGSAKTLYQSIQKLYSLPDNTKLYLCHDYPPDGRPPAWQTTVAEQKRGNIHLKDGTSEAEFVRMRAARDKTLELPSLILPSLQVNIRAGRFPEAESNGVSYLKIPLDVFR